MPGAAIGALLGFALSGTGLGVGLAGFLGVSAGTLWMVGASLGSLFDGPDIDLGGSTPNYTFGQLSNTKSQMLPIPIVYGRCRVGGNVFMQTFYDDTLQKMDMLVGVSEGPIQSIKSIYASDTELTDVNGDITHELEEVTLNVHLGEPGQVADSRDPSGSTYANVAYVGLTLKAQDGLSGNPTISSIVEGRKIWTPAGTVFSRNPAWIVYDFLTNTRYGVGVPQDLIDLDSFMASADYCDALVEGEPRFTLDYIIDTQRPAVDHLQSMLACFRGYFLARDKIELHVEQAGSVYKALGPDNFVKDTFSWWQKSGDDSPNRITLEWIDPDNHYEQSSAVFEHQEDMQARGVFEKSFSVLGVTRSSQVGRLGNYLMETAKRVQNFCSFQVGLQDADIEAGEIISLTYPDFTGWDAKPFRVVAVQDHGDSGLVTITCAEYDATVYGDDALPVQTPIVDPTPVTYDDVYALVLDDIGYIADDGTWFPVIRATWQNPSDYTPAALNIRWRYSGDTVWNLHLNTSRLTTQTNITGLTTGEDLEVWVNCVKPNNGRETTGVKATLSVGRDVTPPAAPTSLTATGWFGSINLEWVNPADRDLSHIEVWENAIDNRATAVKIAETKGTSYQRYVGSFITRYYWVRAVDFSGNIGAWNATAGTAGNSDQENHQDFVDLLLEENPYLQEAIGDLNTRIEPIEFEMPNIEKIPAIEVDLGTIRDVTIPSIEVEIGDIKTIDLPAINANLTQLEEVDLPGAVQRLAERMKVIDADVMAQLRSVSASAVDALLNIAEIGQRITDAGIVVDPDNGEVRIWAVDQLRTEHGVRLSSAEQLISAQAGIIAQKVGIADVDARIAEAVFGNVGELLVSGLEAHITSVEQELNAAKAELTQKATVVEVDAIGGRVGTAETKISGLEASVALKATQVEVDELTSRVTTAEITVDALNGVINQEIVAIGQEGRDLSNLTAEGLVEAILNDAENYDRTKIQLATAKTELYARVNEGLAAEAGQRTTLAATVAGNTAAIIAESTARSDQDSALAQSITALSASTDTAIGEVNALVQSESTTRSDADGALAGQITALESTVSTQDTTLRGLVTTEATTRATQDGVLAGQITALESTVTTNDSTVRGLIASEATTRAGADTALAGEITTLAATVGNNTAAIQTEATTRADADSALSGQITTLQSTVGDNTSAIQTEAETRADTDSAISRYSANLLASIEPVASGLVEDILNQADGRKKALEQYAAIKVDYETKIEDGISSEASKRELLAVRMGDAESAILTESVARATQYEAIAGQVETLQADVGDNRSAIQTESQARTDADSAIASQITTLQASVGANSSAIQTETQTRADADSALSGQITTLQTTVGGNSAAIQTEAETRASADSALSGQITTLTATVGSNTSAIQSEAQVRSDADSALSSSITTVAAVANAKNKTFRQATAPTTGMTAGDLWFDSDDSNKAYRYSGSAWVATEDTRIAGNTAAIQTEATARASADNALASNVSTLQTTVGENTAALQVVSESVDGIQGKHGVRIDVNGYVTGYELIGGGDSGSMVFHVDNFLVGKPGTTNNYPFVIGTVDGVSRVSMDSAFIQDASIKNAKILNATIERLKMADGVEKGLSWGNSSFNSTSQTKPGSGSFTPTGASISIATESKGRVMVNLFLSIQAWNSTVTIYLRKNGSTVQTLASYTGGSYDPYRTVFGFYLDSSPINGTSTYSLFATYSGESINIESCGGSVLAIYR